MSITRDIPVEEYSVAKAIVDCHRAAAGALGMTADAETYTFAMQDMDVVLCEIYVHSAKMFFAASRIVKEYENAHPN